MKNSIFLKYANHAEFLGNQLDDINQEGLFGSKILHIASFSGNNEDIKQAISLGAKIDALGDLGMNAIHYAILGGHTSAIELLISSGISICAENEFGETPIQMARITNQPNIEKLLLEAGASQLFSIDSNQTARQRWSEFKSIQEGNFWKD